MNKTVKDKGTSKKQSQKGKGADLKGLEHKLNYHFKDASLLSSALTHASSQGPQAGKRPPAKQSKSIKENSGDENVISRNADTDNERLEFLGDRVLGLSISAVLIKLYPDSPEGDLARRYNNLVRRQTCTEVAKDIELGKYLILSAGEERSGGRTKSTILANAMEAVLGAIFQDGGYEAADKVIREFWQGKISSGEKVALDAKTALQEWAQGHGYDLPVYKHISRTGPDHSPEFITEVLVEGLMSEHMATAKGEANKDQKSSPVIGRGIGASKRIAEQEAAKNLLEIQKVWPQ